MSCGLRHVIERRQQIAPLTALVPSQSATQILLLLGMLQMRLMGMKRAANVVSCSLLMCGMVGIAAALGMLQAQLHMRGILCLHPSAKVPLKTICSAAAKEYSSVHGIIKACSYHHAGAECFLDREWLGNGPSPMHFPEHDAYYMRVRVSVIPDATTYLAR